MGALAQLVCRGSTTHPDGLDSLDDRRLVLRPTETDGTIIDRVAPTRGARAAS
jgi:hypothetical protein